MLKDYTAPNCFETVASMTNPISWYDARARDLAVQYESIQPEKLHAWLMDLLPTGQALVLDVGAGTGRDAAWLAGRGFDVVAIEPSRAMREEGQRLHSGAGVRWVADALPDLREALRLGLAFDFILLSAVWMHVPESERARAFRKLISLLKPGGLMTISLRLGPAEADRCMYPVSEAEIELLARNHGATIERKIAASDQQGRKEVSWIQIAIRLPDDGSGALPLLRHIILNDDKASTYKLALLRVLCRIADGAAGYARPRDDDYVAVPLGLVGLYWIRLFKPLLAADLPQSPTNRGFERLGFVREGFRQLADISHLDLRVGMIFSEGRATSLHKALRDACETITRMPATYMTFPNGGPVLPVQRNSRPAKPSSIKLDEVYLSAFGEMHVPIHLWKALQRFDVWIEPALVAEWVRLIKLYSTNQGRTLPQESIVQALTWSEPTRDVRLARMQALRLLESGPLSCVWTNRNLSPETLDVDHCFPWVAWPCEDLWNLMPAHRDVNQRQKRDRLPSDVLLRTAHDRVVDWWDRGYLNANNEALNKRVFTEASASLPGIPTGNLDLDDLFDGLSLQRMRLKFDQQIPEWPGPR